MFCPQCGKINEDSTQYCPDCGALLPQKVVRPRPNNTDDTSVNQELEYYKAVIGPKNQDYYLKRFSIFDKTGPSVSWHWPAFFVTFYWFLYRKMWLYALIYFILPYVVMFFAGFLAGIMGKSAQTIIGVANIVYLAAMFLLPPLYANTLYYNHCNNKIAEACTSSSDRQRQLGELSARGGTSNAALIVVLTLVFVAIIGILAAIAIPAYHDYVKRAEQARLTPNTQTQPTPLDHSTQAHISKAVAIGRNAANSAADYYSVHQEFPHTLEETGFTLPQTRVVRDASIIYQTGVIVLGIFGTPVDGSSILLTPAIDENNQISWKCSSQDIPERYLPEECRKKLNQP